MHIILCIAVDCGSLDRPQNGQVVFKPDTTFMSMATYSCDEGFDLFGISGRVCEDDGIWSLRGSLDPVCEGLLMCFCVYERMRSCVCVRACVRVCVCVCVTVLQALDQLGPMTLILDLHCISA